MVRMRMIDADDLPRSIVELPLDPELVQRIHEVPVPRPFLIEVFTRAKRMDDMVLVFVCFPDYETATLIWIGCFCVLVDLM